MSKILPFFLLLYGLPLHGALSPYHQSVWEIESILLDPRLEKEVSSNEPILEIKRTEQGYLILTPRYEMDVLVTPQEQTIVGPRPFTLKFQPRRRRMNSAVPVR